LLLDKLGVEGHIIAECAVIVLELSEADSFDLDTGLACRGSLLRVQVVHEHILIVSESVLNVAIVKCQISAIVLGVAGR
jgi:hypothetical protein